MAKLIVITGPMFSGKSDRLIDFLNHQIYADQKVLALKPLVDDRTENHIATRSKNSEGEFVMTHTFPATSVKDKAEMIKVLKESDFDVLALDEAQFFPNDIVDVIACLLDPNSKEIKSYTKDLEIYISGLDMDAWKEPFGPMPHLMAMADEVIKTSTICFSCKRKEPRAVHTQKVGGTREQIEVGNAETYQARCRECHYVRRYPIYTPAPEKNPE